MFWESNSRANLKKGLMAHYPFNGNALDESGKVNHGGISGAILKMDRHGNTAGCYEFGGGGIHPQVQRDFKEAVRFLRANWRDKNQYQAYNPISLPEESGKAKKTITCGKTKNEKTPEIYSEIVQAL